MRRVWIDADALLVLEVYARAVLRHAPPDDNREVLEQAIKEAHQARHREEQDEWMSAC